MTFAVMREERIWTEAVVTGLVEHFREASKSWVLIIIINCPPKIMSLFVAYLLIDTLDPAFYTAL